MAEKLMLPSEAGRRLGLSSSRVRDLSDAGRLPLVGVTASGYRVFREADVDQFARETQSGRKPAAPRPVEAPAEPVVVR